MFPINVKASEQIAVLDFVAPVSQGAGSATTGWISVANFNKLLAIIQTGVMGASATIDAKFQQANTSAGGAAKDVTPTAITQVVKASGDNKIVLVNLDAQQLDVSNGFAWVQLSVTDAVAASLIAATVLGFIPRNATADAFNSASVVQIVN
jgi:hypothetical protein